MKFHLLILLSILTIEIVYPQNIEEVLNVIPEFVEAENSIFQSPSITIGIVNADSIIYFKNFGKGQIDDLHILGSTSKSFTALITLILQQKGLIDINKPVKEYLSWFKYKDSQQSKKITVKNLLNHTSGIPRKFGINEPKIDIDRQQFYSKQLKQIKIQDQSEEIFEYSNINYILLGFIIEEVSGMNYAEVFKEEIATSLQLNKSFASLKEAKENDLMPSFQHLFYFPVLQNKATFNDCTVASGFTSTTAIDMGNYLKELMNSYNQNPNSTISPTITQQLFHPRTDIGSKYGMGWEIDNWMGNLLFDHSGSTQSFSSYMFILPEKNLAGVILANTGVSPATRIGGKILRSMTNNEIIEYSNTRFYLGQGLPLVSIIAIIFLFQQFIRWSRLGFPVVIGKNLKYNVLLLLGIVISLFWLIGVPVLFGITLPIAVDYNPSVGYSLIVLSIVTLLISMMRYFIKNKDALPNNVSYEKE